MLPSLHYYIDAKRQLAFPSRERWDCFISAYNDSERVRAPFKQVLSTTKIWWMLPEYRYLSDEWPEDDGTIVDLADEDEADLVAAGFAGLNLRPGMKLCVDVTGLMRQHILFLMQYLKARGVTSFDLLYSEPVHYARRAETKFSLDDANAVRQVRGYEGQHSTDMTNDVLILGVGYDHPLMGSVISNKDKAKVVQLHGLPSLSADMYHEAVLRLDRLGSNIDIADDHQFFSSANDPFVTAAVLSEACLSLSTLKPITNLYLSTLGTKAQAIGFALFYLQELSGKPASIIFPCIRKYERETGTGLGRTWIYPINL